MQFLKEFHLSELVKISISYVKALKKSYHEKKPSLSFSSTAVNGKMKLTNNQIKATRPLLKRSLTINPMSNNFGSISMLPDTNRFGRRLNSLQCNIVVESNNVLDETAEARLQSRYVCARTHEL